MSERYEILGKLARGGIGAIYRANDTALKREVAIKRLLPLEETHLNEAADESLQREAAALARFQHPNVVTIYAFEEDEDGFYVVMEMIEGENLKETIERGALPIDDFENLVLQTLDPLIAAKEMNLLHRDIKPSNIMLTWLSSGRFQVKVLDFGLAKFSHAPSTQTLDQTGSFLGSIDYLAPEQLELAPLDQRTDLYSLGCVLYFCLTQRPPFAGKNSAETIQNHLKHKVIPLQELRADVSKPVSDWVMRLISRYPNQRPADSRSALKEFEAAMSGVAPAFTEIEPVVEVVEEAPVARITPSDVIDESPKRPETAGHKRPETSPQAIRRPKLNTAPQARAPRTPATPTPSPEKPVRKVERSRKQPPDKMSELKKPLIALGSSIVAAAIVLIVLLNNNGDEKVGGGGNGQKSPSTQKNSKNSKTASGGKQATGAKQNTPPPRPLPVISNPATPSETAPPPVTDGLAAHFKAGERCWGGEDLQSPVKPGERIKAWGNIAGGAAPKHLLTIDATHRDKGPQLRKLGPKGRPELNRTHSMLTFRNVDRLITQNGSEIAGELTGWTVMMVLRTESAGGQILRLMDKSLPSRILKLEISAKGANYKSTMSKGDSLRPSVETQLGEGKGKFLIFTHTWSGDDFGEQRHHFLLPGNQRKSGKPGDAPHREMPQNPASYALGATAANTAESAGVDAKGIPRKEGTGGFKGDIAEWLIYTRVLSDGERRQVEDYLHQRYFAKQG